MRTISELRAMGLLVLRSWYRMGPRLRGARKPEPTRGVSAVLVRLLFAALFYNFGYTASLRIPKLPEPTWSATWAGLGAGSFILGMTFALELPSPRMPTQPLRSELLELLPLSRLSKLALVLAQAIFALPLGLGLAVSLHGALNEQASTLGAIVLALLLFAAFGLGGACLGKLVRRYAPAHWAARVSWFSSLPMVGGILLLQLAPTNLLRARPPLGDWLGSALCGFQPWRGGAVLAALALLLGAAFVWLERGQEWVQPIRPGSTPSALGAGADMRRLERVLNQREPGGTFQVPFAVLFCLGFGGWLTWVLRTQTSSRFVWNFLAVITLQMVTTLGMQRATRGATRDMLARPLLGALPILPRDTLTSKAATLRRTLLLVGAPIGVVLASTYWHPSWAWELSWRVTTTWLAIGVYASAAVYVAFLTAGLGSTRPRGGALGSMESFLLAVPFASILFAPGPGSAVLALLTLAALSFEARRAALASIDWLDDPEREHSTEVWKALVVFGGFQGAQLLTQQVAALFSRFLSTSVQLLGAYALAGFALWLMTTREQEASLPQYRARYAPLGLVVGALSAGCAWLYLHFVPPSTDAITRLELHSGVEAALIGLTVVGVAPLVEERFFRGWLQPALESSLGARQRYLAPIFAGLAFAAAHPAYSFLPVLCLGLLNGFLMLRFRSLSACMLAHAVHNAFALYLGMR